MNTHTIDTAMAKRMVEASAIRGASIIGQPGGWSVVLKLGLQERALGAQRSDTPRTWRSGPETCWIIPWIGRGAPFALSGRNHSVAVLPSRLRTLLSAAIVEIVTS